MLPLPKVQDDIILEESTEVRVIDKRVNVYSLESSTEEDRFRFSIFFQLLERFTDRVDEELPNMKAKYPGIYPADCTQLYSFTPDFETPENHEWMKMNFPTIKKLFRRRNFSSTIRTKFLVTNVIRHVVHWLNEHCEFERPISYQNVDMIWKTKDGNKKLRTVSFVSFGP